MKRLTEYTIPETGFSVVPQEKYKRILMDEKPSVEKIYNRLKKIEDILGDEYDLDELREIIQAKREGRCVVLPVKEGDIVYCINFHLFDDFPPEIYPRAFHITDYYNIGNTVFLTRAEAEAALAEKGERDG